MRLEPALDKMEGENPERLGRFDSPEYLAGKWRCLVELITGSYAPISDAGDKQDVNA